MCVLERGGGGGGGGCVETTAWFGVLHGRPCAVHYHTAVRVRSRQKKPDSPKLHSNPPPLPIRPSSAPAPSSRPQQRRPEQPSRTMKRSLQGLPTLCHLTRVRAIITLPLKKERLHAFLPRFLLTFVWCGGLLQHGEHFSKQ